jgi:hypothetical protein
VKLRELPEDFLTFFFPPGGVCLQKVLHKVTSESENDSKAKERFISAVLNLLNHPGGVEEFLRFLRHELFIRQYERTILLLQ